MQKYQELPMIQSSLSHKSKSTAIIRYTNTTAKNPQIQFVRFPSINLRKMSNGEVERNTKNKVQILQQQIKQLRSEVKNTRLIAKQTLNNIKFINQTLAINQLGTTKEDLKKKIKALERSAISTRTANQQRSQTIRQDCNILWNQTEQIRQNLYELRIRTDNLEEAMGFMNLQT